MAVSQLPQAPYRQDRKIFPTPIIGDVLFSEVRDCNRGNPFPEYGTPYPNANKWPNHKLVYIKPVDIERNEIFEFFYAAERENQDLYNFAFGLRSIGNREFRTVTRTYVTLRENFKPTDIEFGTPMLNVPEDKFEGVNYVFYDKEQQNTQQEELNALFVIEAHSYVEEAVLDEVLTLSTERQDPLPPKFRVLSPTTTTDELAEGSVETPVLTGDQLAATEDQLNTNLKRKRTVSRSSAENTSSLSGKQVTNDLQVANVVETIVPDGTTITTSALTVDGSVESLGNGQSIQRVITAPELFAAESYSAERPDVVPEKFRTAIPTTTEERSIEGIAETPVLETGDISATEQQQNVHVKRTRKTRRDTAALPKSLTQKATTNDKQLATVTETLQVGDTATQPSALIDIQSEALGDGTYVVRKVEVPELFEEKAFGVEKFDNIPEKFRAEVPTKTQTTNKIGQVPEPQLATGELSRTTQQLNEFVYKEQITKRDVTSNVALPEVQRAYVEGTIAKVNEKLSTSPTIESGLLISESAATPIGDGKFIVQTVKVNEWPQLTSSEWDNELQVQVQKTEQFVAPSSSFTEVNTSYRAVNKDRSLKVTETEPTAALSSYVMSFPIQVDVRLPDVLKSISVVWAEDLAEGNYDSQWQGSSSGTSYGLTGSESASSESSASIKPELIIDIERPWGADVSATAYYFFLKGNNNVISESAFLSKVSRIAGAAQRWPTFKPVSHTIVLTGGSAQVQAKVNWSAARSASSSSSTSEKTTGQGTSYGVGTSLNAVTISPTIHGAITISGAEAKTKLVTSNCNSGTGPVSNFPFVLTAAAASHTLNADVNPKTLAATTPTVIPTSGKYILKSEVVPYKWGWARCSAVVLDASVLA
jgi:hypothetical protein